MSNILKFFFDRNKDRMSSLPRRAGESEQSSSRRDASVPPPTKRPALKTIKYSELNISNDKSKMGKSLPLPTNVPKPDMNDPDQVVQSSVTGNNRLAKVAFSNDFQSAEGEEEIRIKLAGLGDRFYPSPFPQKESDVDYFQSILISKPISQGELNSAILNSDKNTDIDGKNMRKFLDLKKEIEFCKKYLKISEVKKTKLKNEIELIKETSGIGNSFVGDVSDAGGAMTGENLEVRIGKERMELERLRNQMAELGIVDESIVAFVEKSPSRPKSAVSEMRKSSPMQNRVPSIFPDNQGVARDVFINPLSRTPSTFTPEDNSPKIYRLKNNPLITKIT